MVPSLVRRFGRAPGTPPVPPRTVLTTRAGLVNGSLCRAVHHPDGGAALLGPGRPRVERILPGFGVVAVMGAAMLALSVRMIQNYD
jgi:hypothetical protein